MDATVLGLSREIIRVDPRSLSELHFFFSNSMNPMGRFIGTGGCISSRMVLH